MGEHGARYTRLGKLNLFLFVTNPSANKLQNDFIFIYFYSSLGGTKKRTLALARSKKHENKESVRNKIVKKVTNS